MALRLEDKKTLVTEVNEIAQKAQSVVAAEYRGLSVAKLTELRARARASKVLMRVVKNTLARRAGRGTPSSASARSSGPADPRLLAGRTGHGRTISRALRRTTKARADAGVPRWVGAAGQGPRSGGEPPTRAEALAQLLGVLKAPIGKFVRTLAEPHAKLVRTIAPRSRTRSRRPLSRPQFESSGI